MFSSLLVVVCIVTGIQSKPEPGNVKHFPSPLLWEPHSPPLETNKRLRLRFEPYDVTWSEFKSKFDRQYADVAEEQYRRSVFMENVKKIEAHNWDYFNQLSTFYMGINQFTDMTCEEFLASLMPASNFTQSGEIQCPLFQPPLNTEALSDVDWRSKGYVTPVKDQGHCGSCYAFSATGSLEGQYKNASGKLLSLSEQQIVDCSTGFNNDGCGGGLMNNAFVYINSAGGIELETDYPYTAQEGSCVFDASKAVVTVSGCRDIQYGSESQLQIAVSTQGPISVLIDASCVFKDYEGGVLTDPICNSICPNHAVLVVGYGITEEEYWIVKNSWGDDWGEQGYVRMRRNYANMCGIASHASFPVVP